jgi:hypothetical protein
LTPPTLSETGFCDSNHSGRNDLIALTFQLVLLCSAMWKWMKKTVVSAAEGQAVIVTLKPTSDADAERIYALRTSFPPQLRRHPPESSWRVCERGN